MISFIESLRAHYRLSRLLRAMTREGLNCYQATRAIEHHINRGTISLLEEEWLS